MFGDFAYDYQVTLKNHRLLLRHVTGRVFGLAGFSRPHYLRMEDTPVGRGAETRTFPAILEGPHREGGSRNDVTAGC